ncbi:amidohydrolase [Gottfriedia acidiceleris]|uniref:Amidohydrolase n=1 Tax=Gottfriedia acidiceleris TaxID=371036 RepID=A0ABY4JIQ5_9BACI|nr:amidohydrolase [Gottfriedia acidiceleris]UPM53714.1 amidohydrolase [Gottfriedia acidiceleris]
MKFELSDVLLEKLIQIRRSLHAIPELAFEEYKTTATLVQLLTEYNIRILPLPLKTGLVAEIGDDRKGSTIAIRADIDALPIQEETGLPFSSENPNKMHACGHDFHTVAILGTAILLKEFESELPGKVQILFQPAEEIGKGALEIIKTNVLKDTKVIIGMHNKPDLTVGTIGIKSGPLMAAADGFTVEINGKSSHAAVPEAGLDSILTASHIVTSLQSIVSRNISPLENAVVSVTKFHSGKASNVIADKAVFSGTVRTFKMEVRQNIQNRLNEISKSVGDAFRTDVHTTWNPGPPAVVNDEKLARIARDVATKQGLHVIEPSVSTASEDFSYYLEEIPGLFVFFGTSGKYEWHHPKFDLDEKAIPLSISFFTDFSITILNELSKSVVKI